jgi:hypothetical protein
MQSMASVMVMSAAEVAGPTVGRDHSCDVTTGVGTLDTKTALSSRRLFTP